MFNSQGLRKFSLVVAAATFFVVAGCSNQATDQATNQAPAPAKKAVPAKPAASKPAAAKPVAAKPAAKPADTGKVVAAKGTTAKPVNVSSKVTQPAAQPATALVTVPKGTMISAKIDQALASNKNHAGDSFAAILSSSIKVDGKTVIPKGTHITGRVVTAKKSTPELTVALASVALNGKSYKLVTQPISPSSKSPAKTDATDNDAAKAKDITIAAEHRMKFKLAKDVKLPVPAKG